MAYTALLDACVLYPPTLRDLLLRLGERRLHRPLWSVEILEEVLPDAEVVGYQSLVEASGQGVGLRITARMLSSAKNAGVRVESAVPATTVWRRVSS